MSSKDDINTVAGKRAFLKNYMNRVRDELIKKVPLMPEEWNGFELRWLVADTFAWEQMNRKEQHAEHAIDVLIHDIARSAAITFPSSSGRKGPPI